MLFSLWWFRVIFRSIRLKPFLIGFRLINFWFDSEQLFIDYTSSCIDLSMFLSSCFNILNLSKLFTISCFWWFSFRLWRWSLYAIKRLIKFIFMPEILLTNFDNWRFSSVMTAGFIILLIWIFWLESRSVTNPCLWLLPYCLSI